MEEKDTCCLFCSLGCKFAVKVDKGSALTTEFRFDSPVNEGRLCPKGFYGVELLNHNLRRLAPRIREDGTYKEASWEEGLRILISKIAEVKNKYGPQSIGIVIEPNHTNEEVFAAQELARIIGTNNFVCSLPSTDREVLNVPNTIFSGKTEDLLKSNCTFIIGDLFAKHPVLAKKVLDAKYQTRENSIIAVDSRETNTTGYADIHLQNRPGSDALVLAGLLKSSLGSSPEKAKDIRGKIAAISDEAIGKATGLTLRQIARAARTFNEAENGMVILCPGSRGTRDVNLLSWLCRLLVDNAAGKKQLMPLFTFGNAVGAFKMSSRNGGKSLLQLIEGMSSGNIKLLIDFGEDLLSSYSSVKVREALRQLEFLAFSSLLPCEIEGFAHMVFPGASWLEKKGAVNFFDGRTELLEPVLMPPGAAKSDSEFTLKLSQKLNTPLDEGSIRRGARALSRNGSSKVEEQPDINGLVSRINGLVEKADAPDKEYPYLLVTSESTGHLANGAITRNLSWAREHFSLVSIELNTEDAKELGVKDGDEVLISSQNGEITLPVELTEGLRRGVVSVPEGEPETGPERISIVRK